MSDPLHSRRRFLLGTASLIGGIAAVAAAKPSRAAMQSVEINPGSELGTAIANRCGPSDEHADMSARLRAELSANPSLQSASAKCPICGCPVIVSR
jgi:hypothetical protein